MDKLITPEAKPSVEQLPVQPVVEVESKVEFEKTPETASEQLVEAEKAKQRELPSGASPAQSKTVTPQVATRDPFLIQVERELEDGLWDAYKDMPVGLRARFKEEGERIAQVVREGLATGQLTARRIIDMITDWLKMIPHVNKWFLRQQAKIKTDALIRIHEQNQKDSSPE